MMSMVEIKIPIEYTLMGAFKQETIRRENTISNFSKLGHTGYANWISLDNRYMVQPLNNEVKYRIVKQRNGSFHYIVDLASNPTGVVKYWRNIRQCRKCFNRRSCCSLY